MAKKKEDKKLTKDQAEKKILTLKRDLFNIRFKKINNSFFIKLNKLSGQALHAKTLEFIHPKTRKWMSFSSDLPDSFKKILNLLENLSG